MIIKIYILIIRSDQFCFVIIKAENQEKERAPLGIEPSCLKDGDLVPNQ